MTNQRYPLPQPMQDVMGVNTALSTAPLTPKSSSTVIGNYKPEPATSLDQAIIERAHVGLRKIAGYISVLLDRDALSPALLSVIERLESTTAEYLSVVEAIVAQAEALEKEKPPKEEIKYKSLKEMHIAYTLAYPQLADVTKVQFEKLAELETATEELLVRSGGVKSLFGAMETIPVKQGGATVQMPNVKVESLPVDDEGTRLGYISLGQVLYMMTKARETVVNTMKIPAPLAYEAQGVIGVASSVLVQFRKYIEQIDTSQYPNLVQAFRETFEDVQERVAMCGSFDALQERQDEAGLVIQAAHLDDRAVYDAARQRAANKGLRPPAMADK